MKSRELEKDEFPEIPGVEVVRAIEFEVELPELTCRRMHEINANDYVDK